MALLTKKLELTDTWQDIQASLSLSNGQAYIADLVPDGGLVEEINRATPGMAEYALTDNATAPGATDTGQPWGSMTNTSILYFGRRFSFVANGPHVWVRDITGAGLTLVISPE